MQWLGFVRRPVTVILTGAGAILVTACGATTTPPASAAGTPLQQSCQAVTAVLGNGPDPGDDPIGYAEAQILPLRSITTTDLALRQAVDALSAAYRAFYDGSGSASATAAVKAASARVDAVCPGATQ